MKKRMQFFTIFLFVLMLLSACNSNENNTSKDLFQYKDSYVGDNSAVGNILYQLPGAEDLNNFELKTSDEPYGIIINYSGIKSANAYKEMVIHNATFLFTLIQNVDWITFNFDDRNITIEKEQLEGGYSKDLSNIQKEEELIELLDELLKDESGLQNLFNIK